MKRTLIVHPFLFACYAVLGVYSTNMIQVPVQWVARPFIVLLIFMAVVYIILRGITKDGQYAGLVTTLALFWMFFGHIQRALFETSPFWGTPPGILVAFIAWTVPLVFLGSPWTWKRISNRAFVTSMLNFTSGFAILLPAYNTGSSLIQTTGQIMVYENRLSSNSPITLSVPPVAPDIYLIILDAYGRQDFLQEVYEYDNSGFINDLKERGFYVAGESTANYPQTLLSLSSLLNMQYLDELTEGLEDVSSRGPIVHLLQQNQVRRSLSDAGYAFVALPSATLSTQMRDADLYVQMTWGDINEFEGLLLSSTAANLAIDAWDLNIPVPSYELHRRYILFSLDTLETMSEIQGPKFVFSHIMAPHPPFVLNQFGEEIQPSRPFNTGDASGFMGTHEEYIAGYVGEVSYLNRRLVRVIDSILATSDQPPIIIIQGDHGPGNYFNMMEPNNACPKERYSILNAYYFPDKNYDALYPTITPVNSFRVVLNQYFRANLNVLDDRNYYATWLNPYLYNDISGEIRSCDFPLK